MEESVLFWFHSVSLGTWGDGSDSLSSGLHMSRQHLSGGPELAVAGISTAGADSGLSPASDPRHHLLLPSSHNRFQHWDQHLAFNSFCVNT